MSSSGKVRTSFVGKEATDEGVKLINLNLNVLQLANTSNQLISDLCVVSKSVGECVSVF